MVDRMVVVGVDLPDPPCTLALRLVRATAPAPDVSPLQDRFDGTICVGAVFFIGGDRSFRSGQIT